MSRGVSGGTFAAALLAVVIGGACLWLATWTSPLVAAEVALRDGRLTDSLNDYKTAESRLSQVPALQQLAPSLLGSVQANQVRLLYQMERYDEAIEKAGNATSVHGTHFWSGCAMFARASAEERPETRLEWFERAEGEFRAALTAAPADWDTKYNYELTRSLLNRLREEPDTPRRLLFELLRPQSPRSGGTAPARRTG
jgi:tetratricopeptide (TPR) repeat protein